MYLVFSGCPLNTALLKFALGWSGDAVRVANAGVRLRECPGEGVGFCHRGLRRGLSLVISAFFYGNIGCWDSFWLLNQEDGFATRLVYESSH